MFSPVNPFYKHLKLTLSKENHYIIDSYNSSILIKRGVKQFEKKQNR